MKASELRIGNLVDTKEHKSIVISSINSIIDEIGYVWNNHNFGYYQLKTFQPIPLTEQWLLRFGFVKQHERFYVLNDWVVEYREGTKLFNFATEEYIDIIVKYVHQLQNLFFVLTGEELTLNP